MELTPNRSKGMCADISFEFKDDMLYQYHLLTLLTYLDDILLDAKGQI